MKERLKELRKTLQLSQESLGERLGITKASVSRLESGINNLTEPMIKLICSEFNINEEWLRNGTGDMFESLPKDELDKLAARYKLNPMAKRIVECFVTLEESEMDAVLKLVKSIASTTYDEIAVSVEESTVDEIEEEVKRYRAELEAEKKGKISSAFENLKDSQAK